MDCWRHASFILNALLEEKALLYLILMHVICAYTTWQRLSSKPPSLLPAAHPDIQKGIVIHMFKPGIILGQDRLLLFWRYCGEKKINVKLGNSYMIRLSLYVTYCLSFRHRLSFLLSFPLFFFFFIFTREVSLAVRRRCERRPFIIQALSHWLTCALRPRLDTFVLFRSSVSGRLQNGSKKRL